MMCGARAASMARGNAAGFADPREKGRPSKIRNGAGADDRLFTLHDASLELHMHVAAQKVKVNRRFPRHGPDRQP
jgi:hypothetical protein